jgi:hypothetical protein
LEIGNQIACRAGALTLLVAFWFDGGLFKLATAAVFWVLLELGRASPMNMELAPHMDISLDPDKK